MQARRLQDLAAAVGASSESRTLVSGVTHDSQAVLPGDLFAALPGARTHGARFAEQALAAGAVAVLTDAAGAAAVPSGVDVVVVANPRSVLGQVSALVYADSAKARVAGITGTNGKTTVAFLLAAGLAAAGHRTGLLGTVGIRIGSEWLPSVRTTPEAPDVHALLALMVQAGCSHVAMEVSSHALALNRVDGVHFVASGFTNLARDHLDFHESLDDYFAAKSKLFEPQRCERAVVCVDDDYGRRLLAGLAIPGIAVSSTNPADIWAEDVTIGATGSRCEVVFRDGRRLPMAVQLVGDFNLNNALVAVGLLEALGVDLDAAIAGMGALSSVPGRMERIDCGQAFTVLVDYAHTPDAVSAALAALHTDRERIRLVLGCGGDRDAGKRPLMGAAAAAGAAAVWFTSDNPRSEDPALIADQMLAGVATQDRHRVRRQLDRARAIREAIASAEPGDVVLIAGKGHETGQEIDGEVLPFDDREECRLALAEVMA